MADLLVKQQRIRDGGHYTDDSGICSYSSSAVGSISSSSTNYLSNLKSISDSSHERVLPPVSVHLVIPELEIETPLQLNQNDSIWNIKQCILCTIATNLEDGMNHGIYCPPVNGRAGKYLDEERYLGEYNLQEDTVLQLVRKRRVYKSASFDWKKIQEFNTKTRCRKLIHYLRAGNLTKMDKLFARGLDPNFQDESGETALIMAVNARYPRDLIMTLVEGGALLDYRNRLGTTALHRAAQSGNKEAVQTLLGLGAAPNYKDGRGLTPLYYTVCYASEPDCTELLLRDYAIIGVRDESGWTELHQACRFGRVQHLQHLIFYGSDVNARNFSGNTPLHVCALNNQEECARVLLFRGADKTIRNFINQDAESLANLNGYPRLSDIIHQFDNKDVVLYQDTPRYNTRRRRLTQPSHRGGGGSAEDGGGGESWNLYQLQQHLSRSTSHLPDCSSDVFNGGSISSRKSRGGDPQYQSLSRGSSILRKSILRRSLSSSRPPSQLAFEDPDDTLKQPQKPSKSTNLMSCDAAGQRSRARSRSRAAGLASVFDKFKSTPNGNSDGGRINGTSAGCSDLPTPPSSFEQPIRLTPVAPTASSPAPPPMRDTPAFFYRPQPTPSPMPVQENPVAGLNEITCLRDLIRPKPETGSGKTYAWKTRDHSDQGRVIDLGQTASVFRLPPQRHSENNMTPHQLEQQRVATTATGHVVRNQFRHSSPISSSPGHQQQQLLGNQTGYQLETTQGNHHSRNLQGRHQLHENRSSHQLGDQSMVQPGQGPTYDDQRDGKLYHSSHQSKIQQGQGHGQGQSQGQSQGPTGGGVYHWAKDPNRSGPPPVNGTLRNRPAGHQPQQRPHTVDASFRPGPPPPPPRTSASILPTFQSETEMVSEVRNAGKYRGRVYQQENPTAALKPHNGTVVEGYHTSPYSSTPSLYHSAREPVSHAAGAMAQLSVCSALPLSPIPHHSNVETPYQRKFQHYSRAYSPLPPFPDTIGVPDHQSLPPPPPPHLMESYLPPPPMFHSPPPQPTSSNPQSFTYAPPGRASDPRGNLAMDSRRERNEDSSRGGAAMESALFAAVLRRRQAIEGGSRYGITAES